MRARGDERPRATPRSGLAAALAAGALAACGPAEAPEPLVLVEFRQAGEDGVFLDETLVLHFSRPLDRASVTSETVRVLAPDGTPARGRLEVERGSVRFVPDLPLSPSLLDGGLRPGTTYALAVLGFPLPDGVRAADGAPLEATYRSRFRTVERGEGESAVFDAPPPAEPPSLALAGDRIGPLDPIRLECGAALDPRSLDPGAFRLERAAGEEGEPRLERLPLRVRLVENLRERAVVELRPLDPRSGLLRALEPGEIFLWVDPQAGPRTLSGVQPPPSWIAPTRSLARLVVTAVRRDRAVLDFDEDAQRSPEPVPGTDGTAAWSGGEAWMRLPAAVGDGHDGLVRLAGPPPGAGADGLDLHATRLLVPEGARCELPAEGLVVLRSQTSLEIAGELVRPAAASPPPPLRSGGGSLDAWLAEAARAGHAWTVLVAGGDVVVTGEVDLAGPLLLVAGGWIRAPGRVRAAETAKPLWLLAPEPGAPPGQPPRTERTLGGGDVLPEPAALPFALAPPERNPLLVPLRVGALSSPVRPERGVQAWRPARATGRAGAGSFRVRFLGVQRVSPSAVEVFGPVDDVLLLGECEALRVQVELEMPPAAESPAWDPPAVEEVELVWEEPPLLPAPAAGRD